MTNLRVGFELPLHGGDLTKIIAVVDNVAVRQLVSCEAPAAGGWCLLERWQAVHLMGGAGSGKPLIFNWNVATPSSPSKTVLFVTLIIY